jgi:hypothetical protein
MCLTVVDRMFGMILLEGIKIFESKIFSYLYLMQAFLESGKSLTIIKIN